MQVVGQSEHNVEIARVEKLLFARFDPTVSCLSLALVAMTITAAVVGDERISATLGANVDMSAKYCGTAVCNGPDHLELLNGQGVPVDEIVALRAEDVGHLDGGPVHESCFFFRRERFTVSRFEIGIASIGLGIAWR